MEENKKSSKAGWIILIVVICVITAAIGIPYGQKYYDRKQKRAKVDAVRAYFMNELPNDLRPYYDGFQIEGILTIETESEWGERTSGNYRGYVWTDTLTVTLETDESFDKLTDREKYNHLKEFSWIGIDHFQQLMKAVAPDYFTRVVMTIGAYDKNVYTDLNYNFFIKTPKRLYKELPSRTDCYAVDKDGKNIHYLTDPKSKYYVDPNKPTPTPAPKPTKYPTYSSKKGTSSSKTSRTDPYEAHLYSDPDEYAFDYAEEFADEIGEDEDEGYWEAYDHWGYWHEVND